MFIIFTTVHGQFHNFIDKFSTNRFKLRGHWVEYPKVRTYCRLYLERSGIPGSAEVSELSALKHIETMITVDNWHWESHMDHMASDAFMSSETAQQLSSAAFPNDLRPLRWCSWNPSAAPCESLFSRNPRTLGETWWNLECWQIILAYSL